jgi:hypothetical protein
VAELKIELPPAPDADLVITNSYGEGHSDAQLEAYSRACAAAALGVVVAICRRRAEYGAGNDNLRSLARELEKAALTRGVPGPVGGQPE